MIRVAIVGTVLLLVTFMAAPARASCADKHVDLQLASDSLKHSNAYSEESNDDMMTAAYNQGKHWFDLAENEDCSSHEDDDLEASLVRVYDPDRENHAAEFDAEMKRQHKQNAAATYAKNHPSKWALAHPVKKALCDNPNVDATTVNSVAPVPPPEAFAKGVSGTVTVGIDLDENSQIIGIPIIESSANSMLNAAAIKAAQASTFRTEIKNCHPIKMHTNFSVEFNNN